MDARALTEFEKRLETAKTPEERKAILRQIREQALAAAPVNRAETR